MMMGGMFWGSLFIVVLLLGFAFIIWVLADKEKGGIKTFGQVIAAIIAATAVIILLYGTIYGGMLGRGMHGSYGRGYMMGPGMMRQIPEGEMHEYMEKYKK